MGVFCVISPLTKLTKVFHKALFFDNCSIIQNILLQL